MNKKKTFKAHPSQVGKIMTNARTKSEILSKTCITSVQDQYLRHRFGIKKDISNKYIDKGNECEDDSIALYSKVSGKFGIKKNEEWFSDDHFIGTPDVITEDTIIDVKTSWDASTYCWFDAKLPNKDYYYQLMVYMHLTGRKKAIVAYCLTDATEVMIQDEVKRQVWREKLIDATDEDLYRIEEAVRKQMTFGHVPDQLRIRTFDIEYDAEVIEKIQERVMECRSYYESLDTVIESIINNQK